MFFFALKIETSLAVRNITLWWKNPTLDLFWDLPLLFFVKLSLIHKIFSIPGLNLFYEN